MSNFTFLYRIGTLGGTCYAVSIAQARDRAKVDYVKTAHNVDVRSPKFRWLKSQLNDVSIELELAPIHLARYKFLYRSFKDGDCSQEEVTEMTKLQEIINNRNLKWK